MARIECPECRARVSDQAAACPKCGYPIKPAAAAPQAGRGVWGYEWKSDAKVLGWPLVHVAVGRDKHTGRLLVAKGLIAVGQFGIGLITIAQFGVGLLLGLGQFIVGLISISQMAAALYFGLGQFATGMSAIGQFAFGRYVLAQIGYGQHVWSTKLKDPQAVEHFQQMWQYLKDLL